MQTPSARAVTALEIDPPRPVEEEETIAVERGLFELHRGRPVLISDHETGLLVLAAEGLTPAQAGTLSALSGGAVELVLSARRSVSLGLAPRPHAFPWRPDMAAGPLAALAFGHPDGAASEERLRSARPLTDRLTDAALHLARLAETLPVLLVARVPTQTAPPLSELLARGRLQRVDAASVETLSTRPPRLVRLSEALVPLRQAGQARFIAYRALGWHGDHIAVLIGTPERRAAPLVRLHSACVTGDVFASRRCDCGDQLSQTLARMEAEGAGVLCYLAQEGRGIGIVNKLRAYALQDQGLDTLEANEALGFEVDERDYAVAAEILKDLGLRALRLLTNNPAKLSAMSAAGFAPVERVALESDLTELSARYLKARVDKAGYLYGPQAVPKQRSGP